MARREIDEEKGIDRRTFMRGAVAAGATGFIGVTAYGTIRSLVSPPRPAAGTVNPGFIYAAPQDPKLPVWYEELVGTEARIEQFEVGQGAAFRWRAILDEGGDITFPGFPAQLIRMDESILQVPEGFPKDEFVTDGLFGIFNTCTHAGCPPGWQLIPREDYVADPGFDTIYCECHFSQYDPRRLEIYRHPPPPEASGAEYFGVFKLPGFGPADRGMPLIPLELEGSRVIGRVRSSEWYQYLTWKGIVIPEDEG